MPFYSLHYSSNMSRTRSPPSSALSYLLWPFLYSFFQMSHFNLAYMCTFQKYQLLLQTTQFFLILHYSFKTYFTLQYALWLLYFLLLSFFSIFPKMLDCITNCFLSDVCVCVCFCSTGLPEMNSFWSPGWPQLYGNPLASAPLVLSLQVWTLLLVSVTCHKDL